MPSRPLLVSAFSLVLLAVAAPAFATPDARDVRCTRHDHVPPGKSLVTVRVIPCAELRQIAQTDRAALVREAPRTATE